MKNSIPNRRHLGICWTNNKNNQGIQSRDQDEGGHKLGVIILLGVKPTTRADLVIPAADTQLTTEAVTGGAVVSAAAVLPGRKPAETVDGWGGTLMIRELHVHHPSSPRPGFSPAGG